MLVDFGELARASRGVVLRHHVDVGAGTEPVGEESQDGLRLVEPVPASRGGDDQCIGESQTLLDAAKRMGRLDVSVLPICGDDDRLKGKRQCGIVTEGDIATHTAEQKTGELVEAIASTPAQHF